MRTIKHSFYVMVALSFVLLMFFNMYLPNKYKNDNEKEERPKMFLVSDENENKPVRQEYFEAQQPSPFDTIIFEYALENSESIFKITESSLTTKDNDNLSENKLASGIKRNNINNKNPGSLQEVYSEDQLELLNQKIRADPLLQKLASNFKSLKQRYAELGRRYQRINRENKQLKKTTGSTPVKQPSLGQVTAANKKIEGLKTRETQVQMLLRYSNPFYLLGAYPNITLEYFNSYPDGRPYYERPNYGLYNDMDYCELTDLYNLAHPENLFGRKTFFSDYAKNGLARKDAMRKIGFDLGPNVSKYMSKRIFRSRSIHLDPRITMFFTKRVDLHIYHEIGKHFLCATQMYNHIPGHGVLKRKDIIVDSVDAYALRYKDKSSCFNKQKFFPFSYRLYIKEECDAFFNKINSKEYINSLKEEPIQYLIKIGFGSHRAQGVFLLDSQQTSSVRQTYNNGALCGIQKKSLIAQTYVTNPLLLNLNNKFDFRVYMLIASTNPLIVFYHDGFLRVSLYPYDKNSNDRSTHLTNTQLAKDTFAKMHGNNKTLHGMSENELRNYQMWTLERLRDYLLESGKIKDKNWLDNYLRPKFKEAFIHIVRMSAGAFWNQSNVFEMFGLDFMLDSDLNLWFIECNSSPQLIGTNDYKTSFLIKMLKDMFEIQYAYFKSRMKRFIQLIKEMQDDSAKHGTIDYVKWRDEYAKAAKNRLEPEYVLSKNNSFELIMDRNLKGTKAYFGNLKEECVDD